MSDKLAKIFFDELLCCEEHLSISKLSKNGFACFKAYMSLLQEKELLFKLPPLQKSESAGSAGKQTNKMVSQGFPMLWEIAITSVGDVRNSAINFLVESFYKLTQKYPARLRDLTESMLETALEHIKDNSNEMQIKSVLNIIDSIVERIECTKIDEISNVYSEPPLLNFRIQFIDRQALLTLSINEHLKISHLKSLISKTQKANKSLIHLYIPKTRLELREGYDHIYLSRLYRESDGDLLMEIKKCNVPLKDTPRHILANSKIFGKLQNLLNNANEDIVNGVWNLVLSLPLNEEHKDKWKKILAINGEGKRVDWERTIGNYESPGLAYNLYILRELICAKTVGKDDYKELFLKLGGFQALTLLLSKVKTLPKKKLTATSLTQIFYLMSFLTTTETFPKIFITQDASLTLWQDTLQILNGIIIDSCQQNIYDNETEAALALGCFQVQGKLIISYQPFSEMLLAKEYIEILHKSKNYSITN